MRHEVRIRKKALKNLGRVPLEVRQLFFLLTEDLKQFGAIQRDWGNFSKLGENQYHCHLNYSHVACWTHEKGTIIIEVYYVGSREKAPY